MRKANKDAYCAVARALKKSHRFFIAGHRRPDGDSIAAQLVIGSILKRLHKDVDIVTADPIPLNLLFLPGINRIRQRKTMRGRYDAAVIVECSGQDRMGNIIDLKSQADTIINIDHHTHSNCFGDINLLDPAASSSCELIHGILDELKFPVTEDDALCLYTGIMTDTGSFRHANTTSYALNLAAKYCDMGVQPDVVFHHIYQSKSFKDLEYVGRALAGMKKYLNGKVAVMRVPPYHGNTEDLINYGMMIKTVEVTIMMQQSGKNKTRVSMRSRDKVDVGRIAVQLGGGGHARAAGCTISKPPAPTLQKILELLGL